MTSGIYAIRNLIDQKQYIGSSVNIQRRFSVHRCYLRQGRHTNAHLQSAWNLFGEDVFSFEIIGECEADLLLMEQKAIDEAKACDSRFGYNIRTEVSGHYGWKPTVEHRRAMDEGLARYHQKRREAGIKQRRHSNVTEKMKSDLAARNKMLFADPIHGEKRRKAISAALKGQKKTASHIQALKDAWKVRKENAA